MPTLTQLFASPASLALTLALAGIAYVAVRGWWIIGRLVVARVAGRPIEV